MNRFHAPLLLAAVLAVSLPARAEFFNNSSGLAKPDQTITFDEVPLMTDELVTTQFATFGVTFESAWANPDPAPYPNITGSRIGNFTSGAPAHVLFMHFDPVVRGVAFSMVTNGDVTFTALLNDVVVGTGTASTSVSNSSNFFGFRDIALDEVTISVASSNPAFLLDNLQTALVPEPGTWAMMFAGVLLMGSLVRRRRS